MKSVVDLRNEGYKVRVRVDRMPHELGKHWTHAATHRKQLITHEDIMNESVPMVVLRKVSDKKKVWPFGGVMRMDVWTPERKDEEGAPPDYSVMTVCSILDQFRSDVGHKILMNRLEIVMSGLDLNWPYDYEGHR